MKKDVVLDRCNLIIATALVYAKKHDTEVEMAYNSKVNRWRKWTFRKPLTLDESTAKLKQRAANSFWGWDSTLNYPCLTHTSMAVQIKSAALCTEGGVVYISPEDWANL
jgi:hypothetical protein